MKSWLVGLAFVLGCGEGSPTPVPAPVERPVPTAKATPWSDAWILAEGSRYLDDPVFRREALEHSMTDGSNVYSATRLSAYGQGTRGWDVLPVWSPRVHPVTAGVAEELRSTARFELPAEAAPMWDEVRPSTFEGWAALGREVFFSYPLRPEAQAAHAVADPRVAKRVGFEPTSEGSWPGVVAFEDIDGRAKIGITCALCHVSIEDGQAVVGRARRDLDYGQMRLAWHADTGAALSKTLAQRMANWGPGRADITADDDEDPVAIVDLWGLRELRHLTQAATVTHDHPAALAIRQETQILHANRERTRPPRELAWALAVYLYTLEPPPAGDADAPAVGRGASLFEAECSGCHSEPSGAGSPIAAVRVGTDRNLAQGTARGTGLYRPAPLIRVGDAAPYLHDGTVATLEALFGRERLRDGYVGPRGRGAVKGHAYGVDLPQASKRDLIAYLRSR
ncbi:MAG: hypothetical protein ACRBN8_21385 [Nannocystales bacterium]